MLIPWTTCTAATLVLHVAEAFYPYDPSSSSDSRTRRTTLSLRDAPPSRLTVPLRRVPRANTYDILASADPKHKNSVAIDQDGADLSYMAAVTIGSSQEEYHLLLDSAASNTWVMGQECKAEACGKHNTFGEGDSSSLKTSSSPFSITYGTGSVAGTTATDTLHLASLSTPLTFGLASNVSSEFNAYPMDGILGLGRGSASSLGDDAQTLIEALAARNLIPAKLFGMHLSRAADGTADGELDLGEVNSDLFDGEIAWLDAVPNDTGFWEISIADAGAGSKLAGLHGKTAIIDSGTSYVFLPEADAAAVHALVEGSTQSGETFSVPCGTSTSLAFKLGDVTYAVSAADWVGGSTSDGMCRSNVFGRQTFGKDQWLLGDVFLKNVYAAFDLEEGRVGFGTSKAEASSSTSSKSAEKTSTGSSVATGTSEPGETSSKSAAPILPPGASATTTPTSPLMGPESSSSGDASAASAKDQTGASSSLFAARLPASFAVLLCVAGTFFLGFLV